MLLVSPQQCSCRIAEDGVFHLHGKKQARAHPCCTQLSKLQRTPHVKRHAVHFAVYEAAKKGLGNTVAETSFAGAAAAGAAATIVSDACMTPFDVIKQRLQVGAATLRTS